MTGLVLLQDYNGEVLQLLTAPNICSNLHNHPGATQPPDKGPRFFAGVMSSAMHGRYCSNADLEMYGGAVLPSMRNSVMTNADCRGNRCCR